MKSTEKSRAYTVEELVNPETPKMQKPQWFLYEVEARVWRVLWGDERGTPMLREKKYVSMRERVEALSPDEALINSKPYEFARENAQDTKKGPYFITQEDIKKALESKVTVTLIGPIPKRL